MGASGKAYGNRSDLNGPAPIAAASGQAYGARGAQEDAQRAVPMGTPELPGGGGWEPAHGRPEAMPAPGALGDLLGESEDPDEDVMNGASLGAGLGPEAFGMDPDAAMRQEDLAALSVWVPMIQEAVNRTGGSPTSRQFLRAVLGAGAGDIQ